MNNRAPEGGNESWFEKAADILRGNPFDIINRIRSKLGGTLNEHKPLLTLPWQTRLALSCDGSLNKEHIQSLINMPEWNDAAAYLLLKTYDGNAEFQEWLLGELATAYRKHDTLGTKELLESANQELPQSTTVLGTKLAQINRCSPQLWHDSMTKLAQKMKTEGATPCLVAYSMLTGLRAFVQNADVGDHILLLVKHRVDVDKDHSLFLITCNEEDCILEEWTHSHNTKGIDEVHLVDDTIRSGATTEQMRSCLGERANFMPSISKKGYYMIDVTNLPRSAKPDTKTGKKPCK